MGGGVVKVKRNKEGPEAMGTRGGGGAAGDNKVLNTRNERVDSLLSLACTPPNRDFNAWELVVKGLYTDKKKIKFSPI